MLILEILCFQKLNHFFKLFFFIIVGFCALDESLAASQINFKLSSLPLNQWESEQVQKFLIDVDRSLPEAIKKILTEEIKIEFQNVNFDGTSPGADFTLLDRACLQEDIFVTEPKLLNENQEKQIRGYAHVISTDEQKIILNKLFLNEIFMGDKNAKTNQCGHKNNYQLGKATLIHEIAHLYDHRTQISSERRFLHLTTFKTNFFSVEQKNNRMDRSPDIYEATNPMEAFAVNLEYFLLDPEYKCRRPAMYEYYKESLKHEPFSNASCKINSAVEVTGFTTKKMILDPSLLYRVDYLLADKGTSIDSRFGHSMLRLLFCPSRSSTSEACLKDQSNHVIVSFRANIFDENTDSSSGFLSTINYYLQGMGFNGAFPSNMYLFQMPLILAEYNHSDLRDLVSTPLILTEKEKRDLVYRILEIHHGYQGSYQFFTNNCKNETEDLLKSIIRSSNIDRLNKLTPVSMRQGLVDVELADESQEVTYRSIRHSLFKASEDFKHSFNYVYTPAKDHRLANFLNFSDFKKQKTLIEYITQYPADERREFHQSIYDNFFDKSDDLYRNVIGSLLTIESGTLLHHTFQIIKVQLKFFEALKFDFNQLSSVLDKSTFEELKKILSINSSNNKDLKNTKNYSKRNWGPIYKGYGITLPRDLIQASVSISKPSLSTHEMNVISSALAAYAGNAVVELNKTKENISLLRTFLLTKKNK